MLPRSRSDRSARVLAACLLLAVVARIPVSASCLRAISPARAEDPAPGPRPGPPGRPGAPEDPGAAATPRAFTAAETEAMDLCDRFGWTHPDADGPWLRETIPVARPASFGRAPLRGEEESEYGWRIAGREGAFLLVSGRLRTDAPAAPDRTHPAPELRMTRVEPLACLASDPASPFLPAPGIPTIGESGSIRGIVLAAQLRRLGRERDAVSVLDALPADGQTPARMRRSVSWSAVWRALLDLERGVARDRVLESLRAWDAAFGESTRAGDGLAEPPDEDREQDREVGALAATLLRELPSLHAEDVADGSSPGGATRSAGALVASLRNAGYESGDSCTKKVLGACDPSDPVRLVELLDALVAALDDARPTRRVSAWRDWWFPSHRLGAIRDEALTVLERIAGVDLCARRPGNRETDWDATRRRVQDWRETVRQAGGTLPFPPVGEIESDWRARDAFARIAVATPERALSFLASAYPAPGGGRWRNAADTRAFAKLCALVPGPAATEHLVALADDPKGDPAARVIAARALAERNPASAADRLVRAWGIACERRGALTPSDFKQLALALARTGPEGRDLLVRLACRPPRGTPAPSGGPAGATGEEPGPDAPVAAPDVPGRVPSPLAAAGRDGDGPDGDLRALARSTLFQVWCRTAKRGPPAPPDGPEHRRVLEDVCIATLLDAERAVSEDTDERRALDALAALRGEETDEQQALDALAALRGEGTDERRAVDALAALRGEDAATPGGSAAVRRRARSLLAAICAERERAAPGTGLAEGQRSPPVPRTLVAPSSDGVRGGPSSAPPSVRPAPARGSVLQIAAAPFVEIADDDPCIPALLALVGRDADPATLAPALTEALAASLDHPDTNATTRIHLVLRADPDGIVIEVTSPTRDRSPESRSRRGSTSGWHVGGSSFRFSRSGGGRATDEDLRLSGFAEDLESHLRGLHPDGDLLRAGLFRNAP